MPHIRGNASARRNDACPCASGKKFKHCCGPAAQQTQQTQPPQPDKAFAAYWLIADESGRRLFADKDNRALVFSDRDVAIKSATLDEFSAQQPGEINVVGLGLESFEQFKKLIAYVEVDQETAATLIRERIAMNVPQAEVAPAPESQTKVESHA